jgi:hypothetical protein
MVRRRLGPYRKIVNEWLGNQDPRLDSALEASGAGISQTTEQGIVGRSYLARYLNRAAVALLPDLGEALERCTCQTSPGNGLQWDDDAVARHQIEL